MSKKIEARKCVICGKKFTPKTANATVCSEKCRKENKAKRDKARKAKAKSAPKANCVEKITLPKKPVVKKSEAPKKNTKVDTIITVKSGNPFKVAVLALLVLGRAMDEIVNNKKVYGV